MNILITGTSKGIGHALAKEYLGKGHTVYGISRHSSDEFSDNQGFHFLSLDLADLKSIRPGIEGFLRRELATNLELVVLNAGILNEIKDMRDTSLQELKHGMDVNVWANKELLDVLFDMADHIDQVVAISSGSAVSGSRGWNAYAISKAAFAMLIQLYAKEYPGTHFISLAPGLVDTGMQEYISGLSHDKRFPAVDRLQEARGTRKMPSPATAAPMLIRKFGEAKGYDSGSFVDVRQM